MTEASKPTDETAADRKIAVVRTLLERVIGKGERHLIPELCDKPDMVTRGMDKVEMMRAAFPDLTFEIERFEVQGDFVIAYVKGHGTHQGELMGRPPTGKRVEFEGSNIYRVLGDKIAEGWGHLNIQDALRDLFANP